MKETVTIWKRSHDDKYSLCILEPFRTNELLMVRTKITVDTYKDALEALIHLEEYGELPARWLKDSPWVK